VPHLVALLGELILSGFLGRSAEVLHMTYWSITFTSAEATMTSLDTEQDVDKHWRAGSTFGLKNAFSYLYVFVALRYLKVLISYYLMVL
jgi:hypothetical protein